MKTIKMIGKRIILDMRILMETKSFWVFLFLIPMLLMSIVLVFAPAKLSIQVVISWSVMIIGATSYAQISGNFRNSSLYFNSKMNKHDRWTTNLSNILVTVFWGFVALGIVIMYTEFFGIFDLILDDWVWGTPYRDMVFSFTVLPWETIVLIFYSSALISLITCAIGFASFRFFKSIKIYFNIILMLCVLALILGGIFNNYFAALYSLTNDNTYVPSFSGNSGINIFPDYFYYPSLLFPYYAPMQHLAYTANNVDRYLWNPNENFVSWVWLTTENVWNGVVNSFEDIWKWNILWILPYIWIGGFAALGIIADK